MYFLELKENPELAASSFPSFHICVCIPILWLKMYLLVYIATYVETFGLTHN